MADAQGRSVRWYANTSDPAIKAAVVKAHWESCFDKAPGPVLQGALDELQHTSDPNPDVDPDDAHHAKTIPSGPDGPYVTYWFSRALTSDEKEAIGRAYVFVEANLQPD